MPEVQIPVSVVIPALNAATTIDAQLCALLRQVEAPRFRVVVVDNGSTDATAQIAQSYAARGLDLQVVHHPQKGINEARNAGVRVTAANGIVLICDADDVVADGWVVALAGCVGESNWAAGPLDFTVLNSHRTRSLWGGAERMSMLGPTPFRDTGHGSNCGFTRQMWVALGGFDEGLIGHGDETEFFYRAWKAGYKLRWAREATVHHRQRDSARSMLQRRYRQGVAQARLSRRDGYPAEAPQFSFTPSIKAALFATAKWLTGPVTRAPGWALLGTIALNLGRVRGLARI